MLFVLSPVSLLATVHTAGGLWLRVLKARFTCFLWLMHTRYTEPLSCVLTQEGMLCFLAKSATERRREQRYTGACVLRPRPQCAAMSGR